MAIWEVLLLSTKLFIYLGAAALSGGYLIFLMVPRIQDMRAQASMRWPALLIKYMAVFAAIGVVATLLDFFFQVGSLSQTGFAGMFDAVMQDMVVQSVLGTVAISRLGVFTLALAFCAAIYWQMVRKTALLFSLVFIVAIIQWGSVGYTFMLSGHTAQLDNLFRYALAAHVVVALSWMGALWPLTAACAYLPPASLHKLMERFGHIAIGLVTVLIVAGGLLAWKLIGSLSNLLNDIYGLSLLLKLTFVTAVLLLAARHKLQLTPKLLTHSTGAMNMRRSIQIEMVIGLCIFMITAVLTTVLGPQS